MELISVIVPVYNVQDYLERCVRSITSQTYKNLEIILIDDGSTDDSLQIAHHLAKEDSRIKVLHQENAGISAARNAGIDIASGDYFAFVDSDDYIMPEMFTEMIRSLHEKKADIPICLWQNISTDGKQIIRESAIDPNLYGFHKGSEFELYLFKDGYSHVTACSAWGKLYPRQIFNTLRFAGRMHEDEAFNDQVIASEYSFYVMNRLLYCYCQNLQSLTNKPFSKERLFFLDILEKRICLFNNDAHVKKEAALLYCNLFSEYYYMAKSAGIILEPKYKACCKKYFSDLAFDRNTSTKFRFRMALFLISPGMYGVLLKVHAHKK